MALHACPLSPSRRSCRK
ncbi:Os05g0140300 [Oryza sativa Japonica Group]|uniref:Os05g0140300 protein n=1 Tax=Oryza sativa subsp. japonica TaxID=39947 RepID=C7J2U7_ORYSJ|nr:Os05g0140300 [Oryza sativa Japonica Group]|eukprot:NP_001174210.1 Os05g0140300 [Oryza sativa Japonica Group]